MYNDSFLVDVAAVEMCFVRGLVFILLFTGIYTVECDNLLDDVIDSVSKITTFFEKNFENCNLDGIFGIHLSQELSAALLQKISQKCLPQELTPLKKRIDTLNRLQHRLKRISETAIPRIKKQYNKYFKVVGFTFRKGVWKFLYPLQNTNKSLLFPQEKLNSAEVTETFSDHCLNEWDKGNCNISVSCFKYAIEPYHQKYHSTHQYLYLLFGKLLGCEKQIDKMAKEYGENLSTAHLFVSLCTNILAESDQLARSNFPEGDKDLFMEQMGLCGLTGFHEFFKHKWLKEIISWQHSSGCFKNNPPRMKREELVMPGGCLSHQTTVALIALQQSIRYLLEPYLQSNCEKWDAK